MKKKLLHSILFLLCSFFVQDVSSAISGWTQRANFGSHGRHRGTGISIGNKGYMGLGHYNGAGPNIVLNDWWEYDPATNSWTQRADFIGNNGNGNYGSLAFGMDTYGYVGGGAIGSDENLYQYDPVTNAWSSLGLMPDSYSDRQGFVVNNKAYAITGNNMHEFNQMTNSWVQKNSMPFSVSAWNSAFSVDDKGYVKTGSSLWEYKPTTDQWVSRAFFPGLANGGGSAFTQNNKGYFVCGYDGQLSIVKSEVWEFDPAINAWTQLPNFPGSSRRFCVAFTVNNRSYFGIGTNGTNFNDFWEFNADLIYAGVNSLDTDFHVSYGPNPAVDVIRFSSDELTDYTIRVYTMSGQVMTTLESVNAQCELNRNGLPSGTYLFDVIQNNTTLLTKRFIFN